MLKKIVFFPYYAISIFTGAKNFRDNPVIGSKFLNFIGLHILRIILARMVWKLRQMQLGFMINKNERRFYKQNGYLLKENFLKSELFNRITNEVKNYNGNARQCIQGDTATWRVFLDAETLAKFPALSELANNDELLSILKYTAAKNAQPFFYIQQVRNNTLGAVNASDPQKNLHSDTFHPTMKAWLFLEDVAAGKGPFTYVPGSNHLTWPRLKWEYRKSNSAARADRYSAKGSFRVEESELPGLRLPAPKSFAVPQNTLVIANTSGFHARGQVAGENVTRLEIWAYSRPNPFNPLIGIDNKLLRNLTHKIYKSYLARQDQKAAKRNTRAIWHRVSGSPIV